MSHFNILIMLLIITVVILFTRVLPFVFFKNKNDIPAYLKYLELNIPPMILLLLVVYCLKDVAWTSKPFGMPEIISVALVAALHLWKANALLSICLGTVVYVSLINFIIR